MSSDTTLLIRATLNAYASAAVFASRQLIKSWPIIPLSLVLYFALSLLSGVLGSVLPGMAGGFALGMIQLVFLTWYYTWIRSSAHKETFDWRGVIRFDPALFSGLLSVAFIFFIVELILQQLTSGLSADSLRAVIHLGIFILFNPIPEAVYLSQHDSLYALNSSAKFTVENWIEWFLPLLVLCAPLLILSPYSMLWLATGAEPLLPVFLLVSVWSVYGVVINIAGSVLGLIIGTWYMLFRSDLYRYLAASSRRSRVFKARQESD